MTNNSVKQLTLRGLRKAARLLPRQPGAESATAARVKKLEAELDKTRRQLKATRTQVKDMRSKITEAHYDLPDDVLEVVSAVQQEQLTFLKPNQLLDLATIVGDMERNNVPGLLIEAGAARGGSAIVMAKAKAPERPMRVYDVFGLIPPPSDRDGQDVHKRYAKIVSGKAAGLDNEVYYGYRDNLLAEVVESFERHGVETGAHNVDLVKGLFQDTVQIDEPVAFAHLDGDWYESTMVCLERIVPWLSPGGRIVLDDYYNWSGCRRAVHDYFSGRNDFKLVPRAKMHVVRT